MGWATKNIKQEIGPIDAVYKQLEDQAPAPVFYYDDDGALDNALDDFDLRKGYTLLSAASDHEPDWSESQYGPGRPESVEKADGMIGIKQADVGQELFVLLHETAHMYCWGRHNGGSITDCAGNSQSMVIKELHAHRGALRRLQNESLKSEALSFRTVLLFTNRVQNILDAIADAPMSKFVMRQRLEIIYNLAQTPEWEQMTGQAQPALDRYLAKHPQQEKCYRALNSTPGSFHNYIRAHMHRWYEGEVDTYRLEALLNELRLDPSKFSGSFDCAGYNDNGGSDTF